MALPDFICIGAQKAGTSWLYQMLIQHPDLWLPPLKELHFFDRRSSGIKSQSIVKNLVAKARRKFLAANGGGNPKFVEAYCGYLDSIEGDDILSEQWYRRVFDYPGAASKITGEITPAYLDLKQKKFDYAIELLPESTKFIAILRDPLARALSQMRMSVEAKKVDPQKPEEWEFFISHLDKINRGDYKASIPRWSRNVSETRILYLPFADVRERPRQLLAQIESFIGASNFDGYQDFDEQVHVTKKISIPSWVVSKVDARVASQRQFLIDHFGAEFYERTK